MKRATLRPERLISLSALCSGWENLENSLFLTAMSAIPQLTLRREELTRIRVPVLSVLGSRDPLKAGVDAMKGQVPDQQVVIVPGADHLQAVRRPELIGALRSLLLGL